MNFEFTVSMGLMPIIVLVLAGLAWAIIHHTSEDTHFRGFTGFLLFASSLLFSLGWWACLVVSGLIQQAV